MNARISVLFNGYSKPEGECTLANCTCTLVQTASNNIIVDTMTSWDGDRLREALSSKALNCNDVNYVVCTHGHSDHIGCNYLFPNAIQIVGFCISHKNKYFNHDFASDPYTIDDKVQVIATPGHTMQDVSVIVQTDLGVVGITGDLFESEEDDLLWKSAGSDSEELQISNRNRILEMVDYVVPGHGPMFQVNKQS